MRSVPVLFLFALLAGCLGADKAGPTAEGEDAAPPPAQIPVPEPGLFMADPGGLEKVSTIPGVARTEKGGVTHYSWNMLETVQDNQIQVVLMQVLEGGETSLRLDTHVAYDDLAFPGSERRTPPAACFGTSALNVTAGGVGAYYLERALDLPGTLPSGDGRPQGPGTGHGNAAAGPFVNADYTFDTFDTASGDLPAHSWMMYANGISQVPAAATQQEGNRWFVNWTVDVPHRVIHIPPAPYYCYFGLGETQGASVFLEQPYPYIEESVLEIETRYGSTAVLVNQAPDAVSQALTADNRAVVGFLGLSCRADPEHAVVQSSFSPGVLRVDVDRWAGYPTFSLTGLGPWQGMFAVMEEPRTCTPP